MKRLIYLLILLACLSPLASAQNGYVTIVATVRDPTGALYVNSQVGAAFKDPGTSGKLPLLYGSTFQQSYTGYGTDSFAHFSMSVADNQQIAASSGATGTSWLFTITYQDRATSFTYQTPIDCIDNIPVTCNSGVMDISASLQAVAALLPSTGGGGQFTIQNITGSATPVFNSNGNTVFNYVLNQNSTSSTFITNPGTGKSTIFYINICEDAVGSRFMTWPSNVTLPTNYTINPAPNTCSPVAFVYQSFTNTWTPWMNLNIGSGGGGISLQTNGTSNTSQTILNLKNGTGVTLTSDGLGGVTITSSVTSVSPTGCVQVASSTAGLFTCSNLSESNGVLTNGDNNSNRGPNPAVDITAPPFNARALSTSAVPLTTGTITGGTGLLVVASNPGFIKNDGLALIGGGQTNCGTIPASPTAIAALASSMTGTGHAVAGATGSTSYSYAVIGVSQGGCYTAASAPVTISNGNASLGATNIPITSCSNLAGIVTCTVGSTTGLTTGMWVRIGGTTDDEEFGDRHNITIINGTQFTYTSNVSSLFPMFSTTATGGTLYYWVENLITLPALPTGTNIYKEVLYRCTGASCSLPANASNYVPIYISYPLNLGFIDVAYGKVDDYGTISTVTSGLSLPWFIPTTPPSSNVNDMLVTTITNIAGTTFTLASNAINNTSASPVRFDNTPAITSAQAASNTVSPGGGGSVHIPPPLSSSLFGTTCYITSSYLVLSSVVNVGGTVCPGETVELSNGGSGANRSALIGAADDTIHGSLAPFDNQTLLQWNCFGANPCIWRKGTPIKNLAITTSGPSENLVFDSSPNQTLTENVHFNVPDGMGISYIAYEATFGAVFRNTGWTAGPSQVIGAIDTPVYLNRDSIQTIFDGVSGSLRGLYWECTNNPPNSCAFYIKVRMANEWQGEITPIVTINATSGGRYGWIWLEHMIQDSGAESIFVNGSTAGANLASITINGTNQPGRDPGAPLGGNHPIIGGNQNFSGVSVLTDAPSAAIGMNHDLVKCPQSAYNQPGYTGCSLPSMNLATETVAGNVALSASVGILIETATGTITVPHAITNQVWDVYCQAGTCTLAIDSGTLYGNGATGSFVIPPSSGVRVTANGTNAYAYGLGGGGSGGCSPGGSTNALQYNGGGTCSFAGLNAPVTPGDYIIHYPTPSTTAVSPARDLSGVPINPQVGTTYIEGSANYQSDRGFLLTATNSSAQAYTMGNPSGAGFGFNYFNVLWNRGTGTVTENASGFTVNGGASIATPPSWVRWLWSNGVNYSAARFPDYNAFPTSCTTAITIVAGVFGCGASGSVSSWSGDGALYNNVSSTGAVTATLASAGANTVWGNCTTSSGTPSYCQITDPMLAAVSHAALFNVSNVWAGLQDFSGAIIKIPSGAGFTASATSMIGYDTTNKNIHLFQNAADSINCGFATSPSNNNIVITVVASSNVLCSGVTALPNGTTATTQAIDDNSTNIATTAYVDRMNIRSLGWAFGDLATGSTLTTSEIGYITVPYACAIVGYHIIADAGTVTIKTARVNGGTALPTIGSNSISTSGVSLSTGTKVDSTTVTDFTSTAIAANDTLGFFITAVATAKQITFQIDCKQ